LNAFKSVSVTGTHPEECFPALDHDLLGLMDGSVLIDEDVVIGHEGGEAVQVLGIDALVELKCDKFWILCVHWKI
jgi:hypothetical protein